MKMNPCLSFGLAVCAATLLVPSSAQAFRGGGGGGGGLGGRDGTVDRSGSYRTFRGGSGTFNQSVTRSPG